jgi:LysM repeat protein
MNLINLSRRRILQIGSFSLLGVSCRRRSGFELPDASHSVRYHVKPGDTLFYIAKSSGLSVEQIMDANRLQLTELNVGQQLMLPGLNRVPLALRLPRPENPDTKNIVNQLNQPNPADIHNKNYKPTIVKRKDWGASPTKSNVNPMGKVSRITLHHTSEYPGMDKLSDVHVIRKIAHHHRNNLKWADIGYHYLIGRDGKIYEGRPSIYQGAHTGGHNKNNLGISMVGNFINVIPSTKQLSALKSLLSYKFNEYNLSPKNLYGHRDFKATECPGEALYLWMFLYKHSTQ